MLAVPDNDKLRQLLLYGDSHSPEGRSGALYKLACRLGESGVSPAHTQALIEFADKRWGKFKDRNDWSERLQSLLDEADKRRPANKFDKYKPVDIYTLEEQAPETDWLIPNILAKGTYMLVTGGTGIGKSQLTLQLGMALAKGSQWNDLIMEKSRVVYGSHEMSANEVVYFTSKLRKGMDLDRERDIFHVLPIGYTVSLLTDEGRKFYLQYLDDYDVFIFDTVSSSTHLAMLDEATAPGIVAFFDMLTSEGKTVIALGHDTKDAVRHSGARAEDMSGHRYLMDRASTIVRISGDVEDDEHVTLTWPKIRLGRKLSPTPYVRDLETLWLTKTSEDYLHTYTKRRVDKALRDSGVGPLKPEILDPKTSRELF